MKRYLILLVGVMFLGGCVSTGVGASFSPGGGVSGSASFCIDTDSSSYSKTRDALNRVGSLGNIFDTAFSVIHCNSPEAEAKPVLPMVNED